MPIPSLLDDEDSRTHVEVNGTSRAGIGAEPGLYFGLLKEETVLRFFDPWVVSRRARAEWLFRLPLSAKH